jgi:hypothetical protein
VLPTAAQSTSLIGKLLVEPGVLQACKGAFDYATGSLLRTGRSAQDDRAMMQQKER